MDVYIYCVYIIIYIYIELYIHTWDMFHVEEENNLSLAMSSTLFLDQLSSHNQRDHHRVQNLRRYPAV